MSGELAKLLRIVLDFDSSNAAGLNKAEKKTNKHYLQSVKQESTLIDSVALKIMQGTLGGLYLTQINNLNTSPWLNLQISWLDIFNIPFGLVEGSMAAIQSNTDNFHCGTNTTAARKNIQSMATFVN